VINILFYCPFRFDLKSKNLSKLGGIESLNIDLCNELSKKKFKIYLASFCNKEIKKNGVINIPIKKILNKNNKKKFDIIVSSNDPNIFDNFKTTKKILWMHNTLSIEKSIRKKKFISILKNKISVVFVSNYLKTKTSNLYLFNKKTVINNFLSKKFSRSKPNFNRNKIIVWSVQREKGLDDTIKMWKKHIYPINNKIKFYIFGVNKNIYQQKIKKLNKYTIFFYGRVAKEKLRTVYNKSLAMICLGYDETFCLNALEANASGLPILTFGKTALKDYSINNSNSYILSNFNELAKKVISISNNHIDKKMILSSIKNTKKYQINKIVKLWINLLKRT